MLTLVLLVVLLPFRVWARGLRLAPRPTYLATRWPRRRAVGRRRAMAGRWSYSSNTMWVPGKNIPALRAGGIQGGQSLNAAGMQLFGNCVRNAGRLPSKTLNELYVVLTGKKSATGVDAVSVVAALGGVSNKTARQWYNKLDAMGWSSAFTPGQSSIDTGAKREVAVGTFGSDSEALLPDVLPAIGGEAVETEEESDSDCDLSAFGQKCPPAKMEVWREHPNFSVGLRLAELATMWLVHGWQKSTFSQFTAWMNRQAVGCIGTLNHSERWLCGFQASLIQACHTCTASSLHALVPATGTPSFLSRIIDVVSINSFSLLPTIHVYTTCEGKLSWALLDCPCLEHFPRKEAAAVGAGKEAAAVGARTDTTRWFGLHSGEQLINTVHRVERSYNLHRADRAFRLVVTVADQAIQGEGSVRFIQKESRMDSLPLKPLAEGVCKFHVADGVGFNVDKLYGETFVFDRLLRLIRRHFGWGTGHLIYRSIAQKFDEFVEDFRRQETRCLEAVACRGGKRPAVGGRADAPRSGEKRG